MVRSPATTGRPVRTRWVSFFYYPTESDQVNGAGVVDYPNSVYYHVIHPLYGAPGGIPSVQTEEFTFQFTLARPRTSSSKRATRTCPSSGIRL